MTSLTHKKGNEMGMNVIMTDAEGYMLHMEDVVNLTNGTVSFKGITTQYGEHKFNWVMMYHADMPDFGIELYVVEDYFLSTVTPRVTTHDAFVLIHKTLENAYGETIRVRYL
jgi:hypothetical protein